jgi:BioD-like phosphotransacetylase family protein
MTCRSLLIVSTGPFAGKSLLTIGIGRYFQQAGRRVTCLKPVGTAPVMRGGVLCDADALFVAEALGVTASPELVCPVVLDIERRLSLLEGEKIEAKELILNSFRTLSADADLCLIGGGARAGDGYSLGVPADVVASLLDARVLLVDRGGEPESIDPLLYLSDRFSDRLAGIVLNRVPEATRTVTMKLVVPFLEKQGHRVLGVIPQDDSLEYLTVAELAELLGAEVITPLDTTTVSVERYAVGAMHEESALHYFRRMRHKAVITGGDRADLQLAALETSTRCLVLTGGLYPPAPIVARAMELSVPILVVKEDTLTTVERIEARLGKLRLHGEEKVRRAIELVASSCDLPGLAGLLNMK